MEKLVKFNQRGNRVDDKEKAFAFGVIIGQRDSRYYSYRIVNNRKKEVNFINMNEWKIFGIYQEAYFDREKILFSYYDPDGMEGFFETGGRTIPSAIEGNFERISWFIETVFVYFHKITCFKNIESVVEKLDKIKAEGGSVWQSKYNHKFMDTRFY